MFDGFTETHLEGNGVRLFARIGGPETGEPVLLLHGYPQTSAMWHGVAPILAEKYRVICPDLRGYGRSDKPASDDTHSAYSKRAMAADMVQAMRGLGHETFFVGAHDRGARVAHRMGMDYPDRVRAMTLLDIAPTREMYAETSFEFATAYWHWYFLIQPFPLPETIIGKDPVEYWKEKCFLQITRAGGENPFTPEALDEYLQCFADEQAIHASCEDYRAAATIDIEHDDADGDQRLTMPVEVYWAATGTIAKCFDPMALWQSRAENVTGGPLKGTHYMAEEIPAEIAELFDRFFGKVVTR